MPKQGMERLSNGRFSEPFKKRLRAHGERVAERIRREMVLDLANLSDDACGLFRKRFEWFIPGVDDSALLQHRDLLRKFWSGDDEYEASRREFFRVGLLHSWLHQACQNPQRLWTIGTYGDGTCSVRPTDSLLPLSLALAASELTATMGICGNPDCPQKYFLKGRSTQRFCDRPACSAYGQRQHKLKWWDAHKSELRAKPKRSKKRTRKNRRN